MGKRAYTANQAKEMGFKRGEYSAPTVPNGFTGTLVMKIYGDKNIWCYFRTDTEQKLRIGLWYDAKNNNSFHPRLCNIDFSYVELGTRWRVILEKTSKGNLAWINAIPLD